LSRLPRNEGYGTEKLVLLVPVPARVVTAIMPVVAPAGTVAVICVSELTVKFAAVPLKVTAVAPVKFRPVMTTDVPPVPWLGVKLETVGVTENCAVLVAVPPGLVTEIVLVEAPVGTVTVILVSETTVKAADTVPNLTTVVPVKLVPVRVTTVPTGPLLGVKLVITGGA